MAPFGPGMTLTKSQYAAQVAEIEEEEKKAQESAEPKREGSKEANKVNLDDLRKRFIFHDFDYLNPMTKLPVGETPEMRAMRKQALQMTARSLTKMTEQFRQTQGSIGKSIYHASEAGSAKKRRQSRIGDHRSPIRAMHYNRPYLKK